ncbi:uncharacterized protein LOC103698756 [Phoenix dactylifera]|uniref:Uncharacterized protein LOC103698756 n=1 Tax=Phoenix dactylifera TaxID=42345 RepID=A0A8B8J0I1_PHODC|nr:uncharacterized protein LOC103698756 [Phoenix dactylifera]XP_008779024.2 uncharacterized protein LOC103698756 [Phoenix dactylifera]XP_026657500.2 uncharacterized protein LOC103698756 [Phoenix dactylifera]XP_026657503.2 uncharacterized protein LOC103698756 [Phoenix dactylifera]
MPEVVIDVDTGRKRRLPTWMLQVSSPDKQRTSQNGDRTCSLLKDQPETQVAGSKRKRILTQDTDGSDKLDLLQRCEAQQGTRKARRRGLGLDNSTLGEAKTKHKKEAAGGERMLDYRDTTKKQKLKSKRSKNSDPQGLSPGKEDEIEMTVEDLVSMAEEYVNADREKQHEHSITRESHSETHPSSLLASSYVDAGRPIQAAGSGKMLSKCTTTSSSSHSTNTERNKGKSPGAENVATNISGTGDAVQDMLHLFIGPLLKKPLAIEQENGATKTESMNIPNETGKQDRIGEVWSEEGTLILTKKKSSLKDKVAMFLD